FLLREARQTIAQPSARRQPTAHPPTSKSNAEGTMRVLSANKHPTGVRSSKPAVPDRARTTGLEPKPSETAAFERKGKSLSDERQPAHLDRHSDLQRAGHPPFRGRRPPRAPEAVRLVVRDHPCRKRLEGPHDRDRPRARG